jgi:hypothetical protein
MVKFTLIILVACIASTAPVNAQSILDTIGTPDKTVAAVNQVLEGTWLQELRRPGQPATQPPVLNLGTYHPDGTVAASGSDGTQGTAHGVWLRVGDRKFLQTMFVFNFDANRVLTTIFKVRINVLLSLDGQTAKGTTELVIMDRDGNLMATIPGGTYSGVRLSPEMPGDFYDFQKCSEDLCAQNTSANQVPGIKRNLPKIP